MQTLASFLLFLTVGSSSVAPACAADNTPPPGFVALFNGKDLTGWKGVLKPPLDNPAHRAKTPAEQLAEAQKEADDVMRGGWRVEDGVLIFNGNGRSLATVKDYGDFELYVDWKIGPDGDSGIYLRGAPQVQIWDPSQSGIGSGGLYNNKQNPSEPSEIVDNPIGQWNTFHITMIGNRVTVELNGVQVVDHVTLENYWERDKPIYSTGPIELQNHGNGLWFKNIYLREMPRREEKSPTEKPTTLKKPLTVPDVGPANVRQPVQTKEHTPKE
ncbi:MAG: DUF1080 domain-containing protein [Planctomycetaceae bacterium]|nr:DUF1080 domain-containing protein [Planctomycetaceae bacterium]